MAGAIMRRQVYGEFPFRFHAGPATMFSPPVCRARSPGAGPRSGPWQALAQRGVPDRWG